MVSLVGLGGFHLGRQADEQETVRIVRTAVDNGINFLDNCWDYNGGASEIRMGKALRDGYRDKAFLMTKIDGRNKATAARQIDESLRRLQTDRIDLMPTRTASLRHAGFSLPRRIALRYRPIAPSGRSAAKSRS